MRVHHLNCTTQCVLGGCIASGRGSLFSKQGSFFNRAELVSHCLLIETASGLVLVDTGLGLGDIAEPDRRLGGGPLSLLFSFRFEAEKTAIRQIEELGYSAKEVRHIVLTHMDLDHAGGISDFPNAQVHVLDEEYGAAMSPQQFSERMRYRPPHWEHNPRWVRYKLQYGERWFGFECVRELKGLPPEILYVPLMGHSRGHAGVAVQTERGWLLHAGDSYFHRDEMRQEKPQCPPMLEFFQLIGATDQKLRRQNRDQLRELSLNHSDLVSVFSAHDPVEFERLVARMAPAESRQ
jgi:glyoxylase-like metal-dependent hydrolase (beta-lactamase superfamily II)